MRYNGQGTFQPNTTEMKKASERGKDRLEISQPLNQPKTGFSIYQRSLQYRRKLWERSEGTHSKISILSLNEAAAQTVQYSLTGLTLSVIIFRCGSTNKLRVRAATSSPGAGRRLFDHKLCMATDNWFILPRSCTSQHSSGTGPTFYIMAELNAGWPLTKGNSCV